MMKIRATEYRFCDRCGKEYMARKDALKAGHGRYCSRRCSSSTKGRVVASNGYVLIKAVDHPDADVRGYVYEHRLVAEKKIGRRLFANENVHHINRDKSDNRPENLEVLTTHEHHAEHRRFANRGLRSPGEGNPIVACGCGCGKEFAKYDGRGRPRVFVFGHGPYSKAGKAARKEGFGGRRW